MQGVFKKTVIAVLAAVALICLSVSIAVGQTPMFTGVLVSGAIVLACVLWFLNQSHSVREEPELQPPPPPLNVQTPKEKLAERYGQLEGALEVSDNAHTVQIPTVLPPDHNINLSYHCWKTDTHLMLFPLWDSLETALHLLEQVDGDLLCRGVPLQSFSIPIDSILYFSKEPYDAGFSFFTLLRYHNSLGDAVGLLLQSDAYPVLKVLIPNLDLGLIQAQRYPQSAKQILDISVKLQQLKSLRMQSLIDEEEYISKKRQLLTTL